MEQNLVALRAGNLVKLYRIPLLFTQTSCGGCSERNWGCSLSFGVCGILMGDVWDGSDKVQPWQGEGELVVLCLSRSTVGNDPITVDQGIPNNPTPLVANHRNSTLHNPAKF